MNANDFDRRLSDWLGDGPTSAPEQSIAAALDHARAHPRRRDPLAVLRRDPMGSSGGFGFGMRALPIVVAFGLLLVAALAVAFVGGLFDQRPVVVPPVTTPTASTAPTATQQASPSPSITPWPTIEPRLAFGDAVTCGDGTPTFPVLSLNLPPGAEKAADDSGKALAAFLSNPAINPDPASKAGWRRVVLTTKDALFVSTQAPEASWLYVWLASTGAGQPVAGWYFHTSGECRPEVDFGPDARRAEIYLDPGRPINPADRDVRLHLYELNCAGGQSPAGRILEPKLAYESDRILVAVVIRKLPGPRDCQGTDPYAYTLKLAEAIGQRKLLDAARVPPAPVVVQ